MNISPAYPERMVQDDIADGTEGLVLEELQQLHARLSRCQFPHAEAHFSLSILEHLRQSWKRQKHERVIALQN